MSPISAGNGCYGLRYLMAFEAFVGLAFFSLTGAIFFAKIGRTFSRAPVTFSSTICLQYDETTLNKYPVLEFQIVHDKANSKGWEILGASLACMVAIDVQLFDGETVTTSTVGENGTELFALDFNKGRKGKNLPVSRQTYHKVVLEGGSHPYFKRVWHCYHILNENSPLLQNSVKEEIRKNGSWPVDRRSYIGIRSALLHFNTMVSLFASGWLQFFCPFDLR